MSEKRADREKEKSRYSRVSFWISLVTFLMLFGLLAFGSILGVTNLIRMLWKVLGGS
jgi:hypothetical protein